MSDDNGSNEQIKTVKLGLAGPAIWNAGTKQPPGADGRVVPSFEQGADIDPNALGAAADYAEGKLTGENVNYPAATNSTPASHEVGSVIPPTTNPETANVYVPASDMVMSGENNAQYQLANSTPGVTPNFFTSDSEGEKITDLIDKTGKDSALDAKNVVYTAASGINQAVQSRLGAENLYSPDSEEYTDANKKSKKNPLLDELYRGMKLQLGVSENHPGISPTVGNLISEANIGLDFVEDNARKGTHTNKYKPSEPSLGIGGGHHVGDSLPLAQNKPSGNVFASAVDNDPTEDGVDMQAIPALQTAGLGLPTITVTPGTDTAAGQTLGTFFTLDQLDLALNKTGADASKMGSDLFTPDRVTAIAGQVQTQLAVGNVYNPAEGGKYTNPMVKTEAEDGAEVLAESGFDFFGEDSVDLGTPGWQKTKGVYDESVTQLSAADHAKVGAVQIEEELYHPNQHGATTTSTPAGDHITPAPDEAFFKSPSEMTFTDGTYRDGESTPGVGESFFTDEQLTEIVDKSGEDTTLAGSKISDKASPDAEGNEGVITTKTQTQLEENLYSPGDDFADIDSLSDEAVASQFKQEPYTSQSTSGKFDPTATKKTFEGLITDAAGTAEGNEMVAGKTSANQFHADPEAKVKLSGHQAGSALTTVTAADEAFEDLSGGLTNIKATGLGIPDNTGTPGESAGQTLGTFFTDAQVSDVLDKTAGTPAKTGDKLLSAPGLTDQDGANTHIGTINTNTQTQLAAGNKNEPADHYTTSDFDFPRPGSVTTSENKDFPADQGVKGEYTVTTDLTVADLISGLDLSLNTNVPNTTVAEGVPISYGGADDHIEPTDADDFFATATDFTGTPGVGPNFFTATGQMDGESPLLKLGKTGSEPNDLMSKANPKIVEDKELAGAITEATQTQLESGHEGGNRYHPNTEYVDEWAFHDDVAVDKGFPSTTQHPETLGDYEKALSPTEEDPSAGQLDLETTHAAKMTEVATNLYHPGSTGADAVGAGHSAQDVITEPAGAGADAGNMFAPPDTAGLTSTGLGIPDTTVVPGTDSEKGQTLGTFFSDEQVENFIDKDYYTSDTPGTWDDESPKTSQKLMDEAGAAVSVAVMTQLGEANKYYPATDTAAANKYNATGDTAEKSLPSVSANSGKGIYDSDAEQFELSKLTLKASDTISGSVNANTWQPNIGAIKPQEDPSALGQVLPRQSTTVVNDPLSFAPQNAGNNIEGGNRVVVAVGDGDNKTTVNWSEKVKSSYEKTVDEDTGTKMQVPLGAAYRDTGFLDPKDNIGVVPRPGNTADYKSIATHVGELKDAGKDPVGVIEAALEVMQSLNMYHPTDKSPFFTGLKAETSMTKHLFSLQRVLGKFDSDGKSVNVNDMARIGRSVLLAGAADNDGALAVLGSEDARADRAAGASAALEHPWGQMAFKGVDISKIRLDGFADEATVSDMAQILRAARGQEGFAQIKGSSDITDMGIGDNPYNQTSYGQLNNYMEPFGNGVLLDAVGMLFIAVLAILMILALMMVLMLFGAMWSSPKTEEFSLPNEPWNMEMGRRREISGETGGAAFGTALLDWLMDDFLRIPQTDYGFGYCLGAGMGLLVGFPGHMMMDDIEASAEDMGSLADFALNLLTAPAYYANYMRQIVMSGQQVGAGFKDAVSGGGPAVQGMEKFMTTLDKLVNSPLYQFIMIAATLGDANLKSFLGSSTSFGDNRLFQLKYKIFESDYLTPHNLVNNEELKNALKEKKADLAKVGIRVEQKRYRNMAKVRHQLTRWKDPKAVSTLSLSTFLASQVPDNRVTKALGTETLRTLVADRKLVPVYENMLDAEYVPFYFHDLRTHEIVSMPAFVSSFDDSYAVNYNSMTAYGRQDPVRIYNGTERTINLTFKIVAFNKRDYNALWYTVNKLVTMLYPQYSTGISRTLKAESQDITFTQPFSQVPAASPLIRIRLGDVMASNYSDTALKRMFGYTAVLGKDNESATDGFKIDHAPIYTMKKLNSIKQEEINKITGEWNKQKGEKAVDLCNAGKRHALVPAGHVIRLKGAGADDGAFADAKQTAAWEDVYLSRTGRTTLTVTKGPVIIFCGDGDGVKKGKNTKGPEGKVSIVPAAVITKLKKAGFGKAIKGQQILEGQYKKIPDISQWLADDFVVQRFPDDTTKKAEESESYKQADAAAKAEKVPKDWADTVEKFFKPENNAVVRSFHSTRGKGLAGFITSFSMNTADSTWETDEDMGRAPKSVEITMAFAPVHDLPMGLAADGTMRAPTYPVVGKGEAVQHTFGDVYGGDPAGLGANVGDGELRNLLAKAAGGGDIEKQDATATGMPF